MKLEFLPAHQTLYTYVRGQIVISCSCGENLGKHRTHDEAKTAINEHGV